MTGYSYDGFKTISFIAGDCKILNKNYMKAKIKIEKNVPMPLKRGEKTDFSILEVGDSYEVESRNQYVTVTQWAARNKKDWEFTCRTYKNHLRIWRTK